MGYFSVNETEEHIIREYNEKTGSLGFVVHLPKYKLTPDEKMRIYFNAVNKVHSDAEAWRRLCLKKGDSLGYIQVDTLEKEARAQLWTHYFPEVDNHIQPINPIRR